MKPKLTMRQKEVFDFLHRFIEERGFPPTYVELARGLGLRSSNAAAQHIRLLAQKGYVEVEKGRARGLRLLYPDSSLSPTEQRVSSSGGLPLVGRVAAGQPLLAVEHIEDSCEVSPHLFRPRADYLLRVEGDSMIEAGIHSGDLVAVHKTPRVESGQIAVVRLENEVTVKKWKIENDLVLLEPAHPVMKPIVIDPRETLVTCEGLVVGLLRRDMIS